MSEKENAANTGTWVIDAPDDYNTYAKLSNGKNRLFAFGGHQMTKRMDLC
ncbi:MAG TPA: hypothetical protein VEG61_00155 [Candidatus Dormibacteraeota bacterium]|nr:hypothetical protein [Candidatus Dormibacteraeota bacterium]